MRLFINRLSLLSNREEIMTRLCRLNGQQRAVIEGVDVDGRRFLQLDIVEASPDGTEKLSRSLIAEDRARELTAAVLAALEESALADLGRSYV
jgi:hypothetical protein